MQHSPKARGSIWRVAATPRVDLAKVCITRLSVAGAHRRSAFRLSGFLGPQDFRPFDVLFARAGGAPPAPPGRSGARNSAGGLKAPPHAHLARRPRRPPRPRGGAGRARGGLTSVRQFERMLLSTVPIGAVKAKAPPNNALAASLGGIPLAEATHQSVLVPARRSRCHWFV